MSGRQLNFVVITWNHWIAVEEMRQLHYFPVQNKNKKKLGNVIGNTEDADFFIARIIQYKYNYKVFGIYIDRCNVRRLLKLK